MPYHVRKNYKKETPSPQIVQQQYQEQYQQQPHQPQNYVMDQVVRPESPKLLRADVNTQNERIVSFDITNILLILIILIIFCGGILYYIKYKRGVSSSSTPTFYYF